jgi:hypothetical protein
MLFLLQQLLHAGKGGNRSLYAMARSHILARARGVSENPHAYRNLTGQSKGEQLGVLRSLYEKGALRHEDVPLWAQSPEGIAAAFTSFKAKAWVPDMAAARVRLTAMLAALGMALADLQGYDRDVAGGSPGPRPPGKGVKRARSEVRERTVRARVQAVVVVSSHASVCACVIRVWSVCMCMHAVYACRVCVLRV